MFTFLLSKAFQLDKNKIICISALANAFHIAAIAACGYLYIDQTTKTTKLTCNWYRRCSRTLRRKYHHRVANRRREVQKSINSLSHKISRVGFRRNRNHAKRRINEYGPIRTRTVLNWNKKTVFKRWFAISMFCDVAVCIRRSIFAYPECIRGNDCNIAVCGLIQVYCFALVEYK